VPPEATVLRPSPERFAELAAQGNLVPIVREIMADLDTPLSIFRRLDDGQTSFLLESVEGGEKWARYSFIGTGSRAVFRARGRQVEWSAGGRTERHTVTGDPLEFLRERLSAFRPVWPPELELPRFVGGAAGLVGYDWIRFVERIPDANPDRIGLPDLWFGFPETVVVYDNVRHKALIVRLAEVPEGADPSAVHAAERRAIDAVVAKLRAALPAEPGPMPLRAPMEVARSMSEADYHEAVKRAKEFIESGDAF